MNKKMLLLSVSAIVASVNTAHALTADQQLKTMKDAVIAEFAKIDANKDGSISKAEYLNHQFESFRSTIIDASGFDVEKNASSDVVTSKPTKEEQSEDAVKSLGDVRKTLQEMVDYQLDETDGTDVLLSDDADYASILGGEPRKLTLKDVMPITGEETSIIEVPEIDLSVSEEEVLAEMSKSPEQKAAEASAKKALEEEKKKAEVEKQKAEALATEESAKRDSQILMMLETIKKTLPKKIDDMTTWTDVEYKNRSISYIYKADIDTTAFTPAEKMALSGSIEIESCTKAYADMCPKIKPLFLNDGINLKIRYLDNTNVEVGSCEFNDENCN